MRVAAAYYTNSLQRNAIAYIYPESFVQTCSSSTTPSHITLSQEGELPNFSDHVASTLTSDAIISHDVSDLT